MAGDYISREAALMKPMQDGCSAKNLQSISDMPAADVAEVVHGQWIKDDFLSDDVNNAEKCSRCGELIGPMSRQRRARRSQSLRLTRLTKRRRLAMRR